MTRSVAAALVLLAAAGLVGLDVLLLRALEAPPGWSPTDDLVEVVLGISTAAVLTVLGVFLGAIHARRARRSTDKESVERVRRALDHERSRHEDVSRQRHEAQKRIVALEERGHELEHEVDHLRRKLAEAEQSAREAREAADKSGKQLEEAREQAPAAAEREEIAAPRQEASAEQELDPEVRAELEELDRQCRRLRKELYSRRERMTDLQAELSVARTEVEEARAEAEKLRLEIPDVAAPLERLEGESLREVLESIVRLEGVSVALVADDEGLVVDAAGELLQPDALAAVSNVVAELSPRVRDLLPIGEISTVALGDKEGRMMEVRYFPLFGASCALAIIREEEHAHTEVARKAIGAIVDRLQD